MKELIAPDGQQYWDGVNLPAKRTIIPVGVDASRFRLITDEEAETLGKEEEPETGSDIE